MASLLERISSMFVAKAAEPAPISASAIPYARFLMTIGREIHPRDAWALYKSVGVFAKTVDLIADNVAGLKPVVKIGDDIYDEHPAAALINRPGYSRTRRRLIKELATQYLVTGTAYPHLMGNIGQAPNVVDLFASKDVSYIEDMDGFPRSLQVYEARRSYNFGRLPGRDLLYVDGKMSQIVPIYEQQGDVKGIGLSRMQAIRDEIELKLTGTVHNRSVMDNGARPSGMLSFKNRMDDGQLERVISDIRMSSGPQGAGRILVSDGGELDFKAFSVNAKDMDWANLVKLVDQSITDRYNVPITLFTADAQTYNNYSQAWRALYDQAVLPTFNVIYSGLAQALSLRYGEEFEFAHDAMSNEILANQAADRAIKLQSAQMITVNEARNMIGMETVAGGDEIYGPPGMETQYQDLFDEQGNPIDAQPSGSSKPQDQAGAALN